MYHAFRLHNDNTFKAKPQKLKRRANKKKQPKARAAHQVRDGGKDVNDDECPKFEML
jgi:hypothetical protein